MLGSRRKWNLGIPDLNVDAVLVKCAAVRRHCRTVEDRNRLDGFESKICLVLGQEPSKAPNI